MYTRKVHMLNYYSSKPIIDQCGPDQTAKPIRSYITVRRREPSDGTGAAPAFTGMSEEF
jgi:hypothetical protein